MLLPLAAATQAQLICGPRTTTRLVLLWLVACAWCWLGRPAGAQECDCYRWGAECPQDCEYCDGQGGISDEPLWGSEMRNPTCDGSPADSMYSREGTCALCSTEQVVAAMEAAPNDSNVHANALKSLLAGRGDGPFLEAVTGVRSHHESAAVAMNAMARFPSDSDVQESGGG